MLREGSDRLQDAFRSAFKRLAETAQSGPPSDVFEPLGETLFWLTAFAEANARQHQPEILAMTWARDRIAHGLVVVAPLTWKDGSGLTRLMPSRRGYGWRRRADIRELRTARKRPETEQAYDTMAVGRDVLGTISRAFEAAGGTV